jgi:glutathione S-transferase
MKLYVSHGSCALSPHIVLREAGLAFEAVPVNLSTHQLKDGTDYRTINPKGYVPLLELDTGERLAEGPAIIQYIADMAPTKSLAPANGTLARYRLQEWLNFISTEVHKAFSPLFNAAVPEEAKAIYRDKLIKRLTWVDQQLEGKPFLMGEHFSVADPYLFTVTGWARHVGVDITHLANLQAYLARMKERPAVKDAMQAERAMK